MSSEATQRFAPEQLIQSTWNRIRGALEDRRSRILEEIRRYPRPIPACDLQFNALLEERASISRELNELEGWANRHLAIREHIARIDAFITTSAFIIGEFERDIRSSIETVRAMTE